MTPKILIADDSMFLRGVLKDIVEDTAEVVEASTGSEALAQYKKEKPDLVISHNLKGLSFLTPRVLQRAGIKNYAVVHDVA